jgi:hypothetical protein
VPATCRGDVRYRELESESSLRGLYSQASVLAEFPTIRQAGILEIQGIEAADDACFDSAVGQG